MLVCSLVIRLVVYLISLWLMLLVLVWCISFRVCCCVLGVLLSRVDISFFMVVFSFVVGIILWISLSWLVWVVLIILVVMM